MPATPFQIDKATIQQNGDVFFIAEAGVNHNGSTELALQLVDAAVEAGADAIKFQTFTAEEINTRKAPKSTYHIQTTGGDADQSWFDLLRTQEMSLKMHETLMQKCQDKNIIFMSTPYGKYSADLLDDLGVAAYKIASTDLNNYPFLDYVASKKRPMIISTAMSRFDEVAEAVGTIRNQGLAELAVLQCTGNYPSEYKDAHLRVIQTINTELNVISGYSDHTPDLFNPIAAVAMGAAILEKHFTLDRELEGPDHRMSLNPVELKETIEAIRKTEKALGQAEKTVLDSEIENRSKLRKSVVSISDIAKGTTLTAEHISMKRPGNGIEPKFYPEMLGRKATVDIPSDTLLEWEMLE